MTSLAVRLYGRHVATLTQNRSGRHVIEYAPEYTGPPLSSRMPTVGGVFRHATVEPFIDGLLPDNPAVRDADGRRFGVSGRNPYALLTHMGLDCAGAVQFYPEDQPWPHRGGDLRPVSHTEISERLALIRTDATQSQIVVGESRSLAGWQPKIALRLKPDGSWAVAEQDAASTHIVKPGVTGLRLEALTEHVTMAAAALCGLPAAVSSYADFEGQAAIIVERYDRMTHADGTVSRIHQEDFCQALSITPTRKYEFQGGPGAAAMFTLLRGLHIPSAEEMFARYLAFSYVCGASDSHAKNFSILIQPDSSFALAPLYDCATILYYRPRDGRHPHAFALSVGGERVLGQVTDRHWATLATTAHIDPDMMIGFVHDYAQIVPDAFHDVFDTLPKSVTQDMPDTIMAGLTRLCWSVLNSRPWEAAPATG